MVYKFGDCNVTVAFSFLYCTVGRYHSYLNSAVTVIKEYTGDEPLANYLKKFFASNKKYGSKDRKNISHLCYCYYRATPCPLKAGNGRPHADLEMQILTGLFLCSNEPNELLENLKPEWNETTVLSLSEKLELLKIHHSPNYAKASLGKPFTIHQLFPFADELSDGIEANTFAKSFLIQPDLFLRIRPGYKEKVLEKLQVAGIGFEVVGENCIALPNNSKVEDIVALNKEVVVQDYSSQRVGELLNNHKLQTTNHKLKIWDCCAASGGKSILAKDVLGDIDLTVSDIRKSILANLKKRFAEAGIKNYHSFIADLSAVSSQRIAVNHDLIISDVPCTGSGTWARTPEQKYFFNPQSLEQYSHLQKKIVSNIMSNLKPGGYLLYITCSVFKKENEEVVDFIQETLNLILIKKEVLIGYDKKADTMFTALFQKPVTA